MTFKDLGLSKALEKAVSEKGYKITFTYTRKRKPHFKSNKSNSTSVRGRSGAPKKKRF